MSINAQRASEPEPDRPSDSSDTSPEDDPWIGQVIEERYAIESLIAEGGMGVVYAGRHVKLGRRVAIKLVQSELVGNDEISERFAREVAANASLEHPNVVAALDCGTLPTGEAYLVMELADGDSLAEVLARDGALGWRRACEIGAQIADALALAHEAGIVHRDLKPDNILLVPRGSGPPEAKILDFGIARFMEAEESDAAPLTREGTVVGTVGYMAPEQALGQKVNGRADLYALGVLLWEMVAGEALFQRVTLTSFVTTQLADTPRPLSEVSKAAVPPDLARLVTELLVAKQADRTADTRAVRDRLVALTKEPVRSSVDATKVARDALARAREAGGLLVRGARALYGQLLERPPRQILAIGVAIGLVSGCLLSSIAWSILDGSDTAVAEVSTGSTLSAGDGDVVSPTPVSDEDLAVLIDSDDWSERRAAARRVFRRHREGEASGLAIELARVEILNECDSRVEAVRVVGALGDPRAIPALERFREDRCGEPLREAVDQAITRLR